MNNTHCQVQLLLLPHRIIIVFIVVFAVLSPPNSNRLMWIFISRNAFERNGCTKTRERGYDVFQRIYFRRRDRGLHVNLLEPGIHTTVCMTYTLSCRRLCIHYHYTTPASQSSFDFIRGDVRSRRVTTTTYMENSNTFFRSLVQTTVGSPLSSWRWQSAWSHVVIIQAGSAKARVKSIVDYHNDVRLSVVVFGVHLYASTEC